jgi:hypothetical protein
LYSFLTPDRQLAVAHLLHNYEDAPLVVGLVGFTYVELEHENEKIK